MPPKDKKNYLDTQLPNAPLVEVVFELKWELRQEPTVPQQYRIDPGYHILSSNFIPEAAKRGFAALEIMSPIALAAAHSIVLRIRKAEDQPFPLWQIGPGIFASNDSAAYRWDNFVQHTLEGNRILFSSYPKIKNFELIPNYLELRYTDSFDISMVSPSDIINFLNSKTSLKIELPEFLKKSPINQQPKGTVIFEFPVANMKDTRFSFKLGSGISNDKESLILESKVFTLCSSPKVGKTFVQISKLEKWLESAHSITSPFFKQFVDESLMKEFKKEKNASSKSRRSPTKTG